MPWRNRSFCVWDCIQKICGEYKKGHRGIAAQEQEIIFLELNQEGLMETKASHIYIFMFYIFWDLQFLQTQLRRAKNCHSVILTKPCYFSLQLALSVATLLSLNNDAYSMIYWSFLNDLVCSAAALAQLLLCHLKGLSLVPL